MYKLDETRSCVSYVQFPRGEIKRVKYECDRGTKKRSNKKANLQAGNIGALEYRELRTDNFEKKKMVKKRERALISRKRSVRWRGANRETGAVSAPTVRHRFLEIREKCLFVP